MSTDNYLSHRNSGLPGRGETIVVILSVVVVLSIFILVNVYGVLMVDDGYYYLEIARNLSQGNGPTFDGINPTNGFHPLWQMILVPLFLVIRSLTAAAVAATIMQAVFFAAAGYLLYRIIHESTALIWTGTTAALFWLLNFWFWSKGAVSGMETGILLFCFSMTLLMFVRLLQGKSGTRPLTVFLLLTCAARLDSLALAAGICLTLILLRRYRDFIYVSLPVAVYIAAYMAVNRVIFGGFFPVSGYIKSASGTELLKSLLTSGDLRILHHGIDNFTALATMAGRIPVLPAMAFVAVILAVSAVFVKRSAPPVRELAGACCIYVIFIVAYYCFMYDSLIDVYTYYWLPAVFALLLLIFLMISSIGYQWIRNVLLWISFIVLVLFNYVYGSDRLGGFAFVIPDSQRPQQHGVEFLNSVMEDGTVIGSWDAGYVGYYCRHPVVNLDGLVNSYEYQEILADQGFEAYLDMQNITCIANVDHFLGKRDLIEGMGSWTLVFQDSCPFPNPLSIFSISEKEAEYVSRASRIFYVYSRDSSGHSSDP